MEKKPTVVMSHKGCWKKYTQIFFIGILSNQPSDQSLPQYSRLPTESIPIIVSLRYAKYHTTVGSSLLYISIMYYMQKGGDGSR